MGVKPPELGGQTLRNMHLAIYHSPEEPCSMFYTNGNMGSGKGLAMAIVPKFILSLAGRKAVAPNSYLHEVPNGTGRPDAW